MINGQFSSLPWPQEQPLSTIVLYQYTFKTLCLYQVYIPKYDYSIAGLQKYFYNQELQSNTYEVQHTAAHRKSPLQHTVYMSTPRLKSWVPSFHLFELTDFQVLFSPKYFTICLGHKTGLFGIRVRGSYFISFKPRTTFSSTNYLRYFLISPMFLKKNAVSPYCRQVGDGYYTMNKVRIMNQAYLSYK